MGPTYTNDIPYCPTCDEPLRSCEPVIGFSYSVCSCGVWFDNKEQGALDFLPFPDPGKKYTIRPIYVDNVPHCPNCKLPFHVTAIHGNWVCHCNVCVKPNEHNDALEIHPDYRPDAIRYNFGGRSYLISPPEKNKPKS